MPWLGGACGQHRRAVVVGHDLPPMLLRGRGAIAQFGTVDPALDGAAMDAKAPRECGLRDPLRGQGADQGALGHSQGGVCMIVHRGLVPDSAALLMSALTYCTITIIPIEKV